MSSVLGVANTISRFCLQPSFDPQASTFFHHSSPNTLKPRFTKIRAAEIGYDSTTTTITSNPGITIPKNEDDPLQKFLKREYKWGFSEEIDSITIPKGLSEETVRLISALKEEPDWMLEFRLSSFRKFLNMVEPNWSDNRYPAINLQDFCYYSAPKKKPTLNSLDEADPELLKYFDKLGISLNERNRLANVSNSNVAVDAVLDSVSIATTHRKTLEKSGVIFCSISEAIKEYPDLVKKYLGRVVPSDDNYYAALNSAVFSDGSFVYIPKGTRCPMQISTYFRINAFETGQFERTLIVADEGSFVEYLEGCTAPSYDTNQLHAAVVELYADDDAEIKYSTVQNWYAGDEEGKGGIYNFVTKRGLCSGERSKISWTQVETGSAITWKYPSVVLEGNNSVGEFYSVALTNNYQQADTGTKMIHKGNNTRSRIISKGISAGNSRNVYRGLVQVMSKAHNARNSSQCDSMLLGDKAAANTYPYIQSRQSNLLDVTRQFRTRRPQYDPAEYKLHPNIAQDYAMEENYIFEIKLNNPSVAAMAVPPLTFSSQLRIYASDMDVAYTSFPCLVYLPSEDSQVKNPTARIEHEASTSKIGEDQLFYFQQRGIDYERAMAAMISGFCKDVFNELPDEFGAEVNQLMSIKLEGSVG
ncbi:UPF0051 protein ABCI8 chloroplastic [Bienertia sinuspersici]